MARTRAFSAGDLRSVVNEATTAPDLDRLSGRVVAGTGRLLREIERDGTDARVSALAGELWDVTAEIETLLGAVDLERLPDAIDVAALVDADGVADAIRERDPDRALDLREIRRAVELRDLWNAVDLAEFRAASRRLSRELGDVVGPELSAAGGDSAAAADLRDFVDEIRPEAANAALQQQARERSARARRGVLAGHAALEALYVENGRSPAGVARSRASRNRNPTAVSLRPPGPLADGASARGSTVPPAVRGAKIGPLPRIYGRRWPARRPSR